MADDHDDQDTDEAEAGLLWRQAAPGDEQHERVAKLVTGLEKVFADAEGLQLIDCINAIAVVISRLCLQGNPPQDMFTTIGIIAKQNLELQLDAEEDKAKLN